jgi:glucose/arabinose dehydrogenase
MACAALFAAGAATAQAPVDDGPGNRPDIAPAFPEQTEAPERISDLALRLERVADGLVHPWAIAVLPDGRGYLVTERPGRLRHIARDGTVSPPIAGVPEVFAQRQGGLLDVALAPDFADSRVIYLTYAKPDDAPGMSMTAAARARLSPDLTRLTDLTDIFVQTPPSAAPMHYGSRVVPAGDGTVFVSTGEHFTRAERQMAQSLSDTYGVIVRVNADGSVPADNPFAAADDGALDAIWSYGHRNVQGLALDRASGRLWGLEHGPAGGDELNLIAPGANYGWPIASYGVNYNRTPVSEGRAAHAPDFIPPRYYWDPVIAPGGMVVYDGDMFPDWRGDLLASGLVAGSVVRLELNGDTVVGEERLAQDAGRVRDVAVDLDGSILIVIDAGQDAPILRLTRDGG